MLLSAGVGITPLLSMLLSVLKAQPEREVFFVHGALNGQSARLPGLRARACRQPRKPQSPLSLQRSHRRGPCRCAGMTAKGFIDAELLEDMLPGAGRGLLLLRTEAFHGRHLSQSAKVGHSRLAGSLRVLWAAPGVGRRRGPACMMLTHGPGDTASQKIAFIELRQEAGAW